MIRQGVTELVNIVEGAVELFGGLYVLDHRQRPTYGLRQHVSADPAYFSPAPNIMRE
ncbi:hypothetical protein [Devosia soli]|uniref:hypothetical protein n=1 Tax=Devosia soli TaxID=361041 RepID=UPI0013791FE2|nr:hypothetical protein [Devosia soli]